MQKLQKERWHPSSFFFLFLFLKKQSVFLSEVPSSSEMAVEPNPTHCLLPESQCVYSVPLSDCRRNRYDIILAELWAAHEARRGNN